jgi:hypothetical protein
VVGRVASEVVFHLAGHCRRSSGLSTRWCTLLGSMSAQFMRSPW